MKTLIRLLILSAFIFLSDSSFGQTPSDRMALSGQRVLLDSLGKIRPEHYRKTLGLDSAQAAQFAGILDTYETALKVIMQDSGLTVAVRREQVRTLMKERNQELRGILNLRPRPKTVTPGETEQKKTEQPAP